MREQAIYSIKKKGSIKKNKKRRKEKRQMLRENILVSLEWFQSFQTENDLRLRLFLGKYHASLTTSVSGFLFRTKSSEKGSLHDFNKFSFP